MSLTRAKLEPLKYPIYVRLTASMREQLRKLAEKEGFRSEAEVVRRILSNALAVR
jgi:Arc/MetJ-type ribon-helix-helix transcriptional regulator